MVRLTKVSARAPGDLCPRVPPSGAQKISRTLPSLCNFCIVYFVVSRNCNHGGPRTQCSSVWTVPRGRDRDPSANRYRLHGEIKQDIEPSEKITRDVLGGPLNDDPKSLPKASEHGFMSQAPAEALSDDADMEVTPDGEEPTAHEKKTLRHVGESLPFATFLVAFVELCERFTYYGCQGIFQVRNTTQRRYLCDD